LVFIGAYLGSKPVVRISDIFWITYIFLYVKVSENPVPTNPILRQIPKQSSYMKPLAGKLNTSIRIIYQYLMWFEGMLMGGILPFGCVFVQHFFIFSSIW
jgi:hypothetical protein